MRLALLAFACFALAACNKAEAPAPEAATSSTMATAPVADDGWNGKYEGDLRVEISGPAHAHKVSLLVATDDCTGDIGVEDGSVAAQDGGPDELTLTTKAVDEATCKVSLKRQGSRITVVENNCMDFHGPACSFNGAATRVK